VALFYLVEHVESYLGFSYNKYPTRRNSRPNCPYSCSLNWFHSLSVVPARDKYTKHLNGKTIATGQVAGVQLQLIFN